MRSRIAVFVAIVQSLLFLGHLFVYSTIAFFLGPWPAGQLRWLRVAFFLLSISFVPAQLMAFYFYNGLVRLFYMPAAAWVGILNFLILASALCWIEYPFVLLFHLPIERRALGFALLLEALIVSLYGIINAARPRIKRITVKLPNLPPSWRGRTAAMFSDTHLGHVRGPRFLARIVGRLKQLRPDVVFFPGDFFDGTAIDRQRAAAPWKELVAATPFGVYFCTGNHEEIRGADAFCAALAGAGVRVLRNEKVEVDGLQVLGVNNHDSEYSRYQQILPGLPVDPSRASILLMHIPMSLPLSEAHGISLQLSGHTHGGQIFPSTLIAHRIYKTYAYGLQRFRNMQIYTSCGAGTWGPPLRVGTIPEIVLIRFE